MRDKAYYLSMRNDYLPKALKIVFILESPPASGKYFYDEDGTVSEPLFSAMMKLLGVTPSSKREGLEQFAQAGCFLVDSTYTPVNNLTKAERKMLILESFDELVADLRTLPATSAFELILVKANVCSLLENRLQKEGFTVKNNGTVIPFPSHGHQIKFSTEARNVLRSSREAAD